MNYPDISRDPPRDPEIAAWLANCSVGESDAPREGLHAAIMARAQLPLARLRIQPQWWEHAARWALPAVPVALAASMLLALAVGSVPLPGLSPAPDAAATLPMLEDVLTYSVSEAEYNVLVSGTADAEALLSFALQEPR
jgi:hypothetical protein